MPTAGGPPEGGSCRSQHPDDVLIRELIESGRQPTPEEVERVAGRIATAPFDAAVVKVRTKHRGMRYQGIRLGGSADSLEYHLVKRVVVEGQWAHGATADRYLEDLRHAAALPQAHIGIYERHNEKNAIAVVLTAVALPVARLGPNSRPLLVVIHSADRGIMVTGYQVSGLHTVNIPEGTRWLRW